MADDGQIEVSLDLQDGYRFLVDFDQEGVPPLLMDEPEPLGGGAGPSAASLERNEAGRLRMRCRASAGASRSRSPRSRPTGRGMSAL